MRRHRNAIHDEHRSSRSTLHRSSTDGLGRRGRPITLYGTHCTCAVQYLQVQLYLSFHFTEYYQKKNPQQNYVRIDLSEGLCCYFLSLLSCCLLSYTFSRQAGLPTSYRAIYHSMALSHISIPPIL
jgi:hypothetical protein